MTTNPILWWLEADCEPEAVDVWVLVIEYSVADLESCGWRRVEGGLWDCGDGRPWAGRVLVYDVDLDRLERRAELELRQGGKTVQIIPAEAWSQRAKEAA